MNSLRVALLLVLCWPGPAAGAPDDTLRPAAPDPSSLERRQALLDLTESLRLLQVAVRPGDEDAALLACYRRGRGVRTAIAWTTCGEASDDGAVFGRTDALRVVRMAEARAAAAKLGAEVMFLHLPDPGEAPDRGGVLASWGEDRLRERLVRALRHFRPHVVVFPPASENAADGRHRAVLASLVPAVRDAADPGRFDDHLQELLYPWQVRRLFAGCLPEEAGAAVAVEARDPALGVSYAELGDEARASYGSRGFRRRSAAELAAAVHYRRLVPAAAANDAVADDLVAGLVGHDQAELELEREDDFRRAFAVEQRISEAGRRLLALAPEDPAGLTLFAEALAAINELNRRPFASRELAPTEWFDEKGYQHFFRTRTNELCHALRHWLRIGVAVTVGAERPVAADERFALDVKVTIGSNATIDNVGVRLEPSPAFTRTYVEQRNRALSREQPVFAYFKVKVLEEAKPTLPRERAWRERESFAPALRCEIGGRVRDQLFVFTVGVAAPDVVPAVQLRAQPARVLCTRAAMTERGTVVDVAFVTQGPLDSLGGRPDDRPVRFELKAEAPAGLTVRPASVVVENEQSGAVSSHRFVLAGDRAVAGGLLTFRARAFGKEPGTFAGPEFTATVPLDVIECAVAAGRRIGVVAGDDAALVEGLRALGLEPRVLDATAVAALGSSATEAELDTVFVGTHAVTAVPQFAALAGPLLAFAERGGVLVCLGQRPGAWSEPSPWIPVVLEPGGMRVADAASGVALLQREHPLVRAPNRIDERTFSGWVGERGRDFPVRADAGYAGLLAVSLAAPWEITDMALLVGAHGQGAVIYTALALARQLDAAVPGAFCLLANLAAYRPEKGS
ncbi:MAG: PIG-L family deacetylase [Planctomycetes bacterium]|nr:PIG-L family deacetylase [Planctomycetota bacterium]